MPKKDFSVPKKDFSVQLSIPTIDLHESQLNQSLIDTSSTKQDSLEIKDSNEVIWYKCGIFFRSFKYPRDIVQCASLTTFGTERLFAVIFISDMAYIYGIDGTTYTISISFKVKEVFRYYKGLIIEKDISESEVLDQSYTPRFFTLSDPISDLGMIVSSSTTSVSYWETIKFFPPSNNVRLCLTKDIKTNYIHIYDIKYLSSPRKKNSRKSSGRYPKRYSSLALRTAEDPINDTDISASLERRLSVNMVENPITADRMIGETASESGINSFNQNMEKEIVLSKIDSIPCKSDSIKCLAFTSNDKQFVVIIDLKAKRMDIYQYPLNFVRFDEKCQKSESLSAIDGEIIMTSDRNIRILVLEISGKMFLYNPLLNVKSPPLYLNEKWGKPLRIVSADNELVCIETDTGYHQLRIVLETNDELVSKCMKAFEYVLLPPRVERLKFLWSSVLRLVDYDHIHALMAVVLCCTIQFGPQFTYESLYNGPDVSRIIGSSAWDWCLDEVSVEDQLLRYLQTAYSIINSDYGSRTNFKNKEERIIVCLHVIREEYKLDINGRERVNTLGAILALHGYLAKWKYKMRDYYEIELVMSKIPCKYDISVSGYNITDIEDVTSNISEPSEYGAVSPIYLFSEWWSTKYNYGVSDNRPVSSYSHILTLSRLMNMTDNSDFHVTPKLITSLALMSAICDEAHYSGEPYDKQSELFYSIQKLFQQFGLTSIDIQQYSEVMRLPLMEYLSSLTDEWYTDENIDENLCRLIGRPDLEKTVNSEISVTDDIVSMNVDGIGKDMTQVKDVRSVIQSTAEHDSLGAWDDQAEADRIAISRLIFSDDRRFYVVSKLLQSSRVQTVTLVQLPEWNEHEWMMLQQVIFKRTALRTLSIAMGRAALFYSARNPLVTEKYPIPKLNFTLVIHPSNVTVSAQKNVLSEDSLSWGYFHNGVSAGLSISVDAANITGSWIAFNQPGTLTPQYSGFLLGLGLNGHLKKLEEWNIYNYLGPKYEYASVALLLGMAASQLGSMNLKMTKVLSVHVEALLPVGSSDLKVSRAVQSAGIIGIGLLYVGCQHRRMTEVFLAEIDAANSNGPSSSSEEEVLDKNEGYRLSAGIALGLMNLAKGGESIGDRVTERLMEMALMNGNVPNSQILEQSTPGAIMALSLIYLQTNNKPAADKIQVPDLKQLYGHIRPDFLYLRTVAKHVIMWEEIETARDWVRGWIEDNIPSSLKNTIDIETYDMLDSDNIPFFNILAALCMVVGLRHASTGNHVVRDTLMYYLDFIMRLSETNACNQDEAIAKQALLGNLSSLCLAVSTVMAGTGDIIVMRRLRRLYGRVQDDAPNVGFYMANQMAMGILFLGGGQYVFGREPFDIAVLLIAYYPLLANNLRDHRFYLQPLRHFWALAAKNRCLVIRDANTNAPMALDVSLYVTRVGLTQRIKIKAPCLLPELKDIQEIHTEDLAYYPVSFLMFLTGSDIVQSFIKNQTIWVTKKTNELTLKQSNWSDRDDLKLRIAKLSKSLNWIQPLTNLSLSQNNSVFALSAGPYMIAKLDPRSVDIELVLKSMARNPQSIDDCWTLDIFQGILFEGDSHKTGHTVLHSAEFLRELKTIQLLHR